MQARLFNLAERRQVRRAAEAAEDLTGGFYCIPGREWPRFAYDISTLAEAPGPEAPVFADVVLTERRPAGGVEPTARELYRIRLRDDEILCAVESSDVRLFPLLLYVLTHELVHVVRFGSGFAVYDTADGESRRREERRVHAITRRVLRPAEDPALRRVADVYFDLPGPDRP